MREGESQGWRFLLPILFPSSTEDDPGYSNRLSVGTLQGGTVRGARASRLVQLCTGLCWRRTPPSPPPPPPPAPPQGAAPAETLLPLKQSRSYSALTQVPATAGSKNGYSKTTSRSTDDLIEEMKSKSPSPHHPQRCQVLGYLQERHASRGVTLWGIS